MVVLQDVGLGVLAERLAQSKKACSQKELQEILGRPEDHDHIPQRVKSVYGSLRSAQSFRIFGHLCLKHPPTYDTEMEGDQQRKSSPRNVPSCPGHVPMM